MDFTVQMLQFSIKIAKSVCSSCRLNCQLIEIREEYLIYIIISHSGNPRTTWKILLSENPESVTKLIIFLQHLP